MHIKFTKDFIFNGVLTYKEGSFYNLPETQANDFIERGYAEGLKRSVLRVMKEEIEKEQKGVAVTEAIKILRALKIKPEPSDTFIMPPLTEKEIENLRQFYKTKTGINANDLATILLTIYEYAKDTKDNKTLEKVSRDLLTLYRLTMLYGNK